MKMKISLLLILLLSFSFCAFAQNKKEEQKVAQAIDELKKALLDPTPTNLDVIAAEELSYGHSSGLIENKKAFMDALLSGKSDFITLDLSEQSISVVKDVALVRHILTAQISNNGQAANLKLSVLLVWQKQKGKWRLLARQAARL